MEQSNPLEQMLGDLGYDDPKTAAEKMWGGGSVGTPAEERRRDNPEKGGGSVREPREPSPDAPSGSDQLPIPSETTLPSLGSS